MKLSAAAAAFGFLLFGIAVDAAVLATTTTTKSTSNAGASDAGSCTVSDFAQVSAAVKACSALTISGLTVPAGEFLDLTKLQDGATVTFEGTTVSQCGCVGT